ncbi:hypothetical protein Malapachy_3664 [Malassezia pachydermatis]|uniref:CID domain-containing protein n=1 Tax=Malassezia pachydermatis TaxID=77020 RepID=A0A0M9VQX3_9BASI|nr:hypothetical protein Malapachy_3664 [Malassezia pachydermatis]KOS15855.1 hypothetical protein Malapachy_3664 [Malassezia pachydermatis]
MYRSQLAQLTFNSKPIITNLTLIAQEHVHQMSTIVAKVVDNHIAMAPPPYRLPALYLMDSISKNIGSPYTELWAPRVVALFMESYRVVDQPTRRRMEELLATWRNAGPGGRALYGDTAQQTIERSLFGSQGATAKAAAGPTKPQVVANIERLLALQTQALAHRPQDEEAQRQQDTLQQLKEQVLHAEPSPALLQDVQKQLDAMSRPGKVTESTGSGSTPDVAAALAVAAQALAPSASGTAPPSSRGTTPSAPVSAAPASASELIANLMKAGLLPSTSTASTTPAAKPSVHSQDKAYTDYIMSLDLRMTTLNLAQPAPELELLLQEHLPLPCRQCANRYPEGEAGKHALDDHLDWHFTQNRRARASVARGQSRAWLDPVVRWIRSGFDDVMPMSTDDDDGLLGDPSTNQALREKIEHAHVPVPHDADVAARPCRICKEPFHSEWSEDDEEWIWRNAVQVDQVYYHASCYYSAKSMSDSVAAATTSAPPAASSEVKAEEAHDLSLKRKASPPSEAPSTKKLDVKQEASSV